MDLRLGLDLGICLVLLEQTLELGLTLQPLLGAANIDQLAADLSSGDLGGQAGVDFGPSTPPKLMPFSNQLEMVSGVAGVGGWVGKAGERRGAGRGGGGGLNAYISERLSDAERAGVLSHSREQAWTKEWARWSVP